MQLCFNVSRSSIMGSFERLVHDVAQGYHMAQEASEERYQERLSRLHEIPEPRRAKYAELLARAHHSTVACIEELRRAHLCHLQQNYART